MKEFEGGRGNPAIHRRDGREFQISFLGQRGDRKVGGGAITGKDPRAPVPMDPRGFVLFPRIWGGVGGPRPCPGGRVNVGRRCRKARKQDPSEIQKGEVPAKCWFAKSGAVMRGKTTGGGAAKNVETSFQGFHSHEAEVPIQAGGEAIFQQGGGGGRSRVGRGREGAGGIVEFLSTRRDLSPRAGEHRDASGGGTVGVSGATRLPRTPTQSGANRFVLKWGIFTIFRHRYFGECSGRREGKNARGETGGRNDTEICGAAGGKRLLAERGRAVHPWAARRGRFGQPCD